MGLRVVFVAVPSELIGGSGVRVLRVLPHMRSLLEGLGVSWHLYVPCFSMVLLGLSSFISEGVCDGGAVLKRLEEGLRASSLLEYVPGDLLSVMDSVLSSYVPKLVSRLYGSRVRGLRRLSFLLRRDDVIREVESKCVEAFTRSVRGSCSGVVIHSMHEFYEAVYASMRLSKFFDGVGSVLLQIEPFGSLGFTVRNVKYLGVLRSVRSWFLGLKTRNLYLEFLRSGRLRKILSVSAAPIINSGIDAYARRFGADVTILKPSNAVDPQVLKLRCLDGKEPNAIFWARLCREKGVFDVLKAWRTISAREPDAKLIVAGRFVDDRTKNAFFKAIKKLNLRNLTYLGYVSNREELHGIASRAKVLIYPSHSDSFSLVILEALALGTATVAYDIPAITSVYRNLPPVKTVKQGNVNSLATEALRIIKLSRKEYVNMHENNAVKKFLKQHTSWREVAKAELRTILPNIPHHQQSY